MPYSKLQFDLHPFCSSITTLADYSLAKGFVEEYPDLFQDLLQVVFLFALAWTDFYELVLAGDLWSIGIQNRVLIEGATKDVKHAVAIASAQKNKGSLEAESIIRASQP
ncbi:hypothetical protein Tco_0017368 [Tanacetum coccineum]